MEISYKKFKLISTRNINNIKLNAIENGGYEKHAKEIISACNIHLDTFRVDLTPGQLKHLKHLKQ